MTIRTSVSRHPLRAPAPDVVPPPKATFITGSVRLHTVSNCSGESAALGPATRNKAFSLSSMSGQREDLSESLHHDSSEPDLLRQGVLERALGLGRGLGWHVDLQY